MKRFRVRFPAAAFFMALIVAGAARAQAPRLGIPPALIQRNLNRINRRTGTFRFDEETEAASQLTEQEKLEALQLPNDPAAAATVPDLQQQAAKIVQGTGEWGFEFIWIKPDGKAEILTEQNSARPLIPASTMKLFTGWFGFEKKIEPDSFLSEMLHFSVNEMAETLLQAGGGSGKLSDFLAEIGLTLKGAFYAVDGSGLSAQDRVTADLEVDLLRRILKTSDYGAFKVLLAQPGQPGTLESRLPEYAGSLYAKTGTLPLTGVVSLAGFLETKNGTLLFSAVANSIQSDGVKPAVETARDAADALVEMHGRFLESHPQ